VGFRHRGRVSYDSQRIRRAFAVAGLLLSAVFFLFVDLGGTVSGNFSPRAPMAIAIWMVPFVVYLLGVRSRHASLLGGLILLGASTWALVALFGDAHSTAGIGVITLPLLLTFLAAVVVSVDWACAPREPRH
jgi:hypothetical protein